MGSNTRTKKRSWVQDEVDYAATADAFFGSRAEEHDDDDDGVVDGQQDQVETDDSDAGKKESEDGSEESDSSGDEDHDDDDDDDDDNDEKSTSDHDDNVNARNSGDDKVAESAHGEQCTFDLRNLLALNAHQVDVSKLYSRKKESSQPVEPSIAIPPENLTVNVNEEYLLQGASDGCAQLVAALWNLPVERSDAGPMVQLPHYDSSNIPRALVSLECDDGAFSPCTCAVVEHHYF